MLLGSLVVLASIVAPITEELIFRAGLFRYARTRLPRWAALLILVGMVPYLIVVLALRKTVQAPYWPMCTDCDARRRKMLLGGFAGVAASAVVPVPSWPEASNPQE